MGPRQDVLAGIVASTIANANRGKRGRPLKPVDFIPEWQRAADRLAPPSPLELRDKAFAIFGAMQGRGK